MTVKFAPATQSDIEIDGLFCAANEIILCTEALEDKLLAFEQYDASDPRRVAAVEAVQAAFAKIAEAQTGLATRINAMPHFAASGTR
jgi:hypothetical protein